MQCKSKKEEWNWHPQFPIENNPIFLWPFDFKKIIKWYIPMWLTFSETIFCLLIALIFWNFLQPTELAFKEIDFQLISFIYLRNIGLTFFIAGGLHFYLYYLKGQKNLHAFNYTVSSDPSSAAFLIALTLLTPSAKLTIHNC